MTAGFVLTLMGWFAPPMNNFVLNVRTGGPIALLVGFVFMLCSCLMCAVNQGKCCQCCYKTKTITKPPVLNGPIIHRRAVADTCVDSPVKRHVGRDHSVVVANQQTLDYPPQNVDFLHVDMSQQKTHYSGVCVNQHKTGFASPSVNMQSDYTDAAINHQKMKSSNVTVNHRIAGHDRQDYHSDNENHLPVGGKDNCVDHKGYQLVASDDETVSDRKMPTYKASSVTACPHQIPCGKHRNNNTAQNMVCASVMRPGDGYLCTNQPQCPLTPKASTRAHNSRERWSGMEHHAV